MILAIGFVVAAGVAAYEYVTNKKFKAAVTTEVTNAQAEVSSLKAKATSSAATVLIESDFAKVEASFKALVAKL